jgi:hypothetical protein
MLLLGHRVVRFRGDLGIPVCREPWLRRRHYFRHTTMADRNNSCTRDWLSTYNDFAASCTGLNLSANSATRASLRSSYLDFSSVEAWSVDLSPILAWNVLNIAYRETPQTLMLLTEERKARWDTKYELGGVVGGRGLNAAENSLLLLFWNLEIELNVVIGRSALHSQWRSAGL